MASLEGVADQQSQTGSNVVVLRGSAHPQLAESLAEALGASLGRSRCERFPDGEIQVDVDPHSVDGRDVLLVQPTSAPASDHLLELLLLADACRRAGARSISAVIPYFGYARQDRRKRLGEPLAVRVVAQLLSAARFERIVSVDLHSDVTEAVLDVPMEKVSAVPLLARALAERGARWARCAVIVAPDLGAVKLAREYSRLLSLPTAVVHKVRTSGTDVTPELVAGDVRGRRPIIIDDMISTGGTILSASRAVQREGCEGEVVVAATHAVLVPGALERLREGGVRELLVTDTLAPPPADTWTTVVPVAPLLADAVRRIYRTR